MTVTLTRRQFTVDDYARMRETGILTEDDRVELLDGEVYVMSPKSIIRPRNRRDKATGAALHYRPDFRLK
jgi:hypothetical protein